VFNAALPGITPPPPVGIPSAEANVKTWHFAFSRLDDLPEVLLEGRERAFLTWLFRAKCTRPWMITPADLDEYVRVNAAPGATRAALSYYRHKLGPEGLAHSRARAERKLAMPVLAYGAETGVGGSCGLPALHARRSAPRCRRAGDQVHGCMRNRWCSAVGWLADRILTRTEGPPGDDAFSRVSRRLGPFCGEFPRASSPLTAGSYFADGGSIAALTSAVSGL